MVDFNEYLNRKYANLEAQTANQGQEQAARANLLNTQAGSGFFEAEAEKQRQLAETGRLSNIPGQFQEQMVLGGAYENYRRRSPEENFLMQSSATGGDVDFGARAKGLRGSFRSSLPGFKKGTAEVMKKGKTKVIDKTGNGKPDVDTVPAMLAEGEAVLNVAAAERMGRENIKELNQQGLRDMNMDDKARPVIKKGGRLGAYSGIEMATPKMSSYQKGTNFAKTSPDNDAEYHPTEYREPRDPEHDAEHMALPIGSGGVGYSLRKGSPRVMKMEVPGYMCGTSKVKGYAMGTADVRNKKMAMKVPKGMMGYAEGTADAGASTPASEEDVNDAGVLLRGMRSYARGTAAVPGVTAMEMAGFERQRDRNQLDEAMPYGTSVMDEPAGERASVTPSRNTARLREQFNLTAQGFAMGTESVQMAAPEKDGVVYAAVGMEDVKNLGSRAMAGLRGMFASAPVEAPVAAAAPAAAPAASASEFATRQAAAVDSARAAMGEAPAGTRTATPDFAARQAEAARSARMAMGETPSTASQPLRGGAGAPPNVPPSTPAAAAAPSAPSAVAAAAPSATSKVLGGLRMLGRASLPVTVGLTAVDLFNRGMQNDTGQGYGDAVEQATVGTLPAQPVRQTPTNSVIIPDGAVQTAGVAAPTTRAAGDGLRGGGGGGGGSPFLGLTRMGAIMGNQGSAAVLQDLTRREEESGRNARSAIDQAIKASAGKNNIGNIEIYDPPRVDEKTGQTVPGARRPDREADFTDRYLPVVAASKGIKPSQLSPLDVSNAKAGFELGGAAQEYALRSGNKAFNFSGPLVLEKTKFVDDIGAWKKLFGTERGEASFAEGILDDGMIVVTDGKVKQELPIAFLEERGTLANPQIFDYIKTLKAQARNQK